MWLPLYSIVIVFKHSSNEMVKAKISEAENFENFHLFIYYTFVLVNDTSQPILTSILEPQFLDL